MPDAEPERPTGGDDGGPVRLDRGSLQRRAIAGASWTLLNTVVSLPLAFLVNIAVAHFLGVVSYGRLATLSTTMDIVGGIISMGLGVGLVQFGSRAHAAGDTGQVRSLLSKSQGFRLLIDIPVLTAVILIVGHSNPVLLGIAVVFGVVVPAAISGAPACLGIENKTDAGAKNAMIANVVTQAGVLVVAFWFRSADAVWAIRLALGGLAVAGALWWISPGYRRAVLHPSLPEGFPHGSGGSRSPPASPGSSEPWSSPAPR